MNALSTALSWRLLAQTEAHLAYQLHSLIIQGVAADMVRHDTLDFFEKHIEEQGLIIGCFAQAELIAYGVLSLQSPMINYMGQLLNLDRQQQARICVLDGASCRPEWQRRGLHRQVITLRFDMAQKLDKNVLTATVAPANLPSLRNLFHHGFIVRHYAEIYGGVPRLLLVCDHQAQAVHWQRHTLVNHVDWQGHCEALQLGLTGYCCLQDPQQIWSIAYGKQSLD